MIAVELIVIDVDTRSSGMPSNSRHVFDRIDGDADPADFTGGKGMVGVVAHLRRQVDASDTEAESVPACETHTAEVLARSAARTPG